MVLSSIFISPSFGQSGNQNGFIITQTQDTVYGEVIAQARSKYYQLCRFRANGQVSNYVPAEIKGYGIIGDRYFSSEIKRGQFVEVLVLSDMSLFGTGENFLVKKRNEVHELIKPAKYRVYVDYPDGKGEFKLREDDSWLSTLAYLVSDCNLQWQDQLKSLDFNRKDLTNFSIRYNTCKNAEIFVPQGNKPWYQVSFGLTAGMITTKIQINSMDLYHQSDSYSSIDPFLGLQMEISAPRSPHRLSLQLETRVFKSSFQGFKEDSISNHTTSFGYTTVSVPVSINYSIPVGRNAILLQLGGNYDHYISKYSERRSDFFHDQVVHTFHGPVFDMKNNSVGIWTGLGYLQRFKKFSVGASARYIPHFNMVVRNPDGESTLSTRGSQVSFSLILQRP